MQRASLVNASEARSDDAFRNAERGPCPKQTLRGQGVDAGDADEEQEGEGDAQDAGMMQLQPALADVVDEDLGEIVAPATPADSWRVAYIYAYLVKFTDLCPASTPNKKSFLLDMKSFEDALLASSPPSTAWLRRHPRTGLLQSDYRPASAIHRATWLPSEITQAEYEYDQLVAQAQTDHLPPPPFPTTGPLSTELYEIPSPPKSALLIEIMQRFYDIMGYFPEFYNPKDRKGWFAWCVRFMNTRLGSGPLKGGIGWEVNLMRRVGVKIGREDEGNFWRLKWEEKVHVIQHIIDYLLTYGKAIRREIKVAYENERDPKDGLYQSSSSSEDEAEDPSTTDAAAAAATMEEEPEALNPLAFEPLGTTSTRTMPRFEEAGERKESLMMVYALDSSARLFGLAFPLPRERNEEEEEENLGFRVSPADPAFEWRTLTRSIDEYNAFVARVEELEAKDAEREAEGKEKTWLIDAPLRPPVKMRVPKTKASSGSGVLHKKRKRRATIGGDGTPRKRPMRSTVLGKRSSNYFDVEEIEDDEPPMTEGGRRSLRTRARRLVQQQQEQEEDDESTDGTDNEDEEPEAEPVPIPTKALSQVLKDRLANVQQLQTVLDGLHAQREEEEKFIQERLGAGAHHGTGVGSSSDFTLDSINGLGGGACTTTTTTTTTTTLPPRLPTPPPPPIISARSARLRVQEEKAQSDYYTQLNEQAQRQRLQHELAQREHLKKQEAKVKAQAMKLARMEEKKREEEERERWKREMERKELEKRIRERRAEGEGGRRLSKRLSLQLGVDEERLRSLVEEERKREEEGRKRREEEKREKEVKEMLKKEMETKGGSEKVKMEQGGEARAPSVGEMPMVDGTAPANGSTVPPPTESESLQPPTTNGFEAAPLDGIPMAGNKEMDTSQPPSESSAPTESIEPTKKADPILEVAPSILLETPAAPSSETTTFASQPETMAMIPYPKSPTPPLPPTKTTAVEDQDMTDGTPTPSTTTTTDKGIP